MGSVRAWLDRRTRKVRQPKSDHPCFVCIMERWMNEDGIPYERKPHACIDRHLELMPAGRAEVVPAEGKP